jgi:hypothetical protein
MDRYEWQDRTHAYRLSFAKLSRAVKLETRNLNTDKWVEVAYPIHVLAPRVRSLTVDLKAKDSEIVSLRQRVQELEDAVWSREYATLLSIAAEMDAPVDRSWIDRCGLARERMLARMTEILDEKAAREALGGKP